MKTKFRVEGFDGEKTYGMHESDGQPTGHDTLQPVVEGKPLQEGEEIVRVEAVEGNTLHLKTVYAHHKGPSRASSPSYRSGYDAVFGKKQKELN
jgi:hypothetical protein